MTLLSPDPVKPRFQPLFRVQSCSSTRRDLSAGSFPEQWLAMELRSCIILIEAVSHATICAICLLSIIANPHVRNYPPVFLTKRYRRDENWPTDLTSVAVQPIYVFCASVFVQHRSSILFFLNQVMVRCFTIQTFVSVDEIPSCFHSNETSWADSLNSTIEIVWFYKNKFDCLFFLLWLLSGMKACNYDDKS